jgi:DNA polymerase/3'-5' exonuclease PolX
MSLAKATGIANLAMESLRPGCVRVEVAGSIRRRQVDVGDIEIVAIPRFRMQSLDLFGERKVKVSELEEALAGTDWQIVKGADKFKQLIFRGQYKIDLYIQPDVGTWGVNLALRTGSRDFSKWLVTPRAKGGALPDNMYVKDAKLWRQDQWGGGYWRETPEEEDFFREIGLGWFEPEERTAGLWWQAEKYARREEQIADLC